MPLPKTTWSSFLTDTSDNKFHEKSERKLRDYVMRIDRVDFCTLRRCLEISADDRDFDGDVASLLYWYHFEIFSPKETSNKNIDQMRKIQRAAKQLLNLMDEISPETWDKLDYHSHHALIGHLRPDEVGDLPFWNWDTVLTAISTLECSTEWALASMNKPKGRKVDAPLNMLLTHFAKLYEEKTGHSALYKLSVDGADASSPFLISFREMLSAFDPDKELSNGALASRLRRIIDQRDCN